MKMKIFSICLLLFFCTVLISCKEKKPNIPIEEPELIINDSIEVLLNTTYIINTTRSLIIETSDPDIVQVNSEANSLMGVGVGTAKVKISFVYFPEKTKEITVSVIDTSNITLKVGESYTFDNPSIEEVISDNPDILDSFEKTVVAIAPGETEVIILFTNGEEETAVVNVIE